MQPALSFSGPLRGASLGRPLPRSVAVPRRPNSSRLVAQAGLFSKGGGEKEDAARKALQDALAGKKDPFAAAEERARKRGGGGGGGGGSGGGGGGGGSSGGFNFSEWGDSFRKGTSSFFKTVATILLFGATLFALTLWRPLLAFLASLVRIVLRLDGNPRAQLAKSKAAPQVDLSKKDGLGNVEEAVLSKYAAADDEDEGEAESGDEEE